jgi:hypothetical protein
VERKRPSVGQDSIHELRNVVTEASVPPQPSPPSERLLATQIANGLHVAALEQPSAIEMVTSFAIGDEVEVHNPEKASKDGFHV